MRTMFVEPSSIYYRLLMGFLNRRDEQVNSVISWLFMGGEVLLLGVGITLVALGVATTVGWTLVVLGGLLLLLA